MAWFEFPEPDAPEVVVYDTRAREVVVRTQVSVEPGNWVAPHSVDDESAIFFLDPDPFADDQMPQVRLDLTTDAQAPVSPQDYLADVGKRPGANPRDQPSGEWISLYEITDGAAWNFGVEGGRVQPQGMQPLQVRDALTGKRFAFDAPAEYPRSNEVWLVQWLDDDTVVLLSTEGEGNDLIECHVSTRACQIAVSGPDSLVAPEVTNQKVRSVGFTPAGRRIAIPNVVPRPGNPRSVSGDRLAPLPRRRHGPGAHGRSPRARRRGSGHEPWQQRRKHDPVCIDGIGNRADSLSRNSRRERTKEATVRLIEVTW